MGALFISAHKPTCFQMRAFLQQDTQKNSDIVVATYAITTISPLPRFRHLMATLPQEDLGLHTIIVSPTRPCISLVLLSSGPLVER